MKAASSVKKFGPQFFVAQLQAFKLITTPIMTDRGKSAGLPNPDLISLSLAALIFASKNHSSIGSKKVGVTHLDKCKPQTISISKTIASNKDTGTKG
jgi:hypothetical protein